MGKKKSKYVLTVAQTLLATHLAEIGIATIPEFQFWKDRRFRFDLYAPLLWGGTGFEVNGHFNGIHGRGWSGDAEKANLAQMMGMRVLVFTNRQVMNGEAIAFVKEWIGKERA